MKIHVSFQQIYHIWRFVFLHARLQTPVCILATQPSLTRSQPNLSSSADFQCCTNFDAMRSLQMLKLPRIMTAFEVVICRGSCFHSGSQYSIRGQHQGLVDVGSYHPVRLVLFSMCVGFSQLPILPSVQSVVHRSC
jgi:hypothetical protein